MIAKEIRNDAIEVFARCEDQKMFDKISSAIEVLRNESLWDASIGMMDISCPDSRTVVLPRDVETALSVQLDGVPLLPRNRWFEFHLNGPGRRAVACTDAWMDYGDTVMLKDIHYPFTLHVELEDGNDAGKIVEVRGRSKEGIELREELTDVSNSSHVWSSIGFIAKEPTEGIVRLYATNVNDSNQSDMIGLYYPDEEEVRYRKIVLPRKSKCVRMMYRKAFTGIRSWEDYIPLNSKYALKNAMQAVKYIDNGDLASGANYLSMARNLANKEQEKRNPKANNLVQINEVGRRSGMGLWQRGRWR